MRHFFPAFVVASLVSLIGVLFMTGAAQAAWDWCYNDPAVSIAGKQVNIEVGVPSANLSDVQGPVPITIYVPSDVTAYLLSTNKTYFTEKVKFVKTEAWGGRGSLNINVEAIVKSGQSFPTAMDVSYVGKNGAQVTLTVMGSSNATMSISLSLDPSVVRP